MVLRSPLKRDVRRHMRGRRWRFAILTVGDLVLLIFTVRFLAVWLESGVVAYRIRGRPVIHALANEPVRYYVEIGLAVLAIALFLIVLVFSVVALVKTNDPRLSKFIDGQITGLENSAPSGLRPLWIGLLLFIGAFAVYALFNH
jgi:hypothetical protein